MQKPESFGKIRIFPIFRIWKMGSCLWWPAKLSKHWLIVSHFPCMNYMNWIRDAIFLKQKHRRVRLSFVSVFDFQLCCEYPRCCTGTGHRSVLPEWIKEHYSSASLSSSQEKDIAGSTIFVPLPGILLDERLSICCNYHKHLWLIWDSTWDLLVSDILFSTIDL